MISTPLIGQTYYSLDVHGFIDKNVFEDSEPDKCNLSRCWCFNTEKEAEDYLQYLKELNKK